MTQYNQDSESFARDLCDLGSHQTYSNTVSFPQPHYWMVLRLELIPEACKNEQGWWPKRQHFRLREILLTFLAYLRVLHVRNVDVDVVQNMWRGSFIAVHVLNTMCCSSWSKRRYAHLLHLREGPIHSSRNGDPKEFAKSVNIPIVIIAWMMFNTRVVNWILLHLLFFINWSFLHYWCFRLYCTALLSWYLFNFPISKAFITGPYKQSHQIYILRYTVIAMSKISLLDPT